ncbi:hypothetical protein ACWELJ_31160 [Nocardia sp. NPDC004582]
MSVISAPLIPVAMLVMLGCRVLQVTEAAYYRWRHRFGGPPAP